MLYSLPELDGAIDTVPLGGLVKDDIYLIPERVSRLLARVRKWTALARKPPPQRRVAVLLYGFPPGVGATGTAALLNVPESLERTLGALRDAVRRRRRLCSVPSPPSAVSASPLSLVAGCFVGVRRVVRVCTRTLIMQGYDLGPDVPEDLTGAGEALVSALRRLESPGVVSRGADRATASVAAAAAAAGATVAATDVPPRSLHKSLAYPEEWGPTEWGPVPFLPRPDLLVHNMEKAWGDLYTYRGLNSTARGDLFIGGLQVCTISSHSLALCFPGCSSLSGAGPPQMLLFFRSGRA